MIKLFRLLSPLLLGILLFTSCAKSVDKADKASFDPYHLDSAFVKSIDDAFALFETGRSGEAAERLMEIYRNEKNIYFLYLIHCYQSEILYYNNLPDQGFIITDLILKYANELDDSLTKASAFNFYGLHAINKKEYTNAIEFFKQAKLWYPSGKSYPNQVKYFHILSNLAEAYLKIGALDSVLVYTISAEQNLIPDKYQRGHAINQWLLGQVEIQQRNYTEAQKIFIQAKETLGEKEHFDMQHFFIAGILLAGNHSDFLINPDVLIKEGLDSLLFKNSTILGKVEFLDAAVAFYISKNNFRDASYLQSVLLTVERDFSRNEQRTGANLLSNFFQSINALELEKKLKENSEKELTLSRALAFSAIALLILLGFIFHFLIKQGKVQHKLNALEYHNKMKLINKEKEIEVFKAQSNAVLGERNRIARELHDDIGSSISSIQIYLSIAQKKALERDLKETISFIDKTAKSAKEIAENVSDLVWAIYSKNDSFENLMNKMKQFAFDMFEASEIEFDFDYSYALKDLSLGLEERRNIYLIFKEIVNNALKYSNCNIFKVLIRQSPDNTLSFIFSDNGVGISDTDKENGNGLQTLQARARSIDGSISLHTGKNEGTIYTLVFKPSQEDINPNYAFKNT